MGLASAAAARVARLRAVVLALGTIYLVSLIPGIRGDPGLVPLLDHWLSGTFRAGVIVLLVVQGRIDRRLRAAWWLLAAGLAVALMGSIGYWAHYGSLDPVP